MSRVGVFGKLPAAGDFVALGTSSPVAQAYQRWIQQENDGLAAKGKALPNAPVRFLWRDATGLGAMLGVIGPSRDRVGRVFPLTLMTFVDMPVAVQRFPSLPAAYDPFLDGATQLLTEAPSLDPRALLQRVEQLPQPSPQDFQAAHLWTHQALDATPGQTILEALFGPLSQGAQYFGVHMFRTACGRVRGGDPGGASIYLECPCVDDVQLAFWLVFAKALLQWHRAPPSFFWTDVTNPDHRLILALGSPTPGTLAFLADRSLKSDRLWPTVSNHPSSIESGRKALSPIELRTLEPPAPTASALLAGLSHIPPE